MPTFKRQDQEQFEKAQDLLEGAPVAEPGFVKSLFFGRLNMAKILPYPQQDPAEAIQTEDLLRTVDAIMADLDPDKVDAEEEVPRAIVDRLAAAGVLGMTVPRQYGGGGFSHTAYCRVLQRLSSRCASTAVVVGAHQSIGLKALMLMGSEPQKQQFLPDLAAGRKLAAFCLSEPEVGSDAANVQTTARLSEDGSHYILNGHKRYATNAAIAGFMTVMAKTPVTLNGKTRDKVTAFIVTPDLPGFEIVSRNRPKMGVRGSWQATLRFNDMLVPRDRVLGEFGKGLKVALSVLDFGRCTLSAGCVGGAWQALELAAAHARQRKQFGRAIGEFGLVKQKLARMAEMAYAMDAMTYLCAGMVDRHESDTMLETAIAKLFCSEGLWQIVDDTLQIWGGEGYMREHGIERMVRDARINRIVEGTTEVMTAFTALVGMKGVGDELEGVLRLAKHPLGNVGRLAHFARQQFDDILVGPSAPRLHDELASEGHSLARLTNHLAREVLKVLRTYREKVLDHQLLLHRIAWSAIELYAIAAVISKLQSELTASAEQPSAIGDGRHSNSAPENGLPTGAALSTGAPTNVVASNLLPTIGIPSNAAPSNGSSTTLVPTNGAPSTRATPAAIRSDGNGSPASPATAASTRLRKDLLIGKAFCRHAADRITRHLHSLFVNSDDDVEAVANAVLGWPTAAPE